jgi:hypothetical protein
VARRRRDGDARVSGHGRETTLRLGAASAGFGAVAHVAERRLRWRVGSERGHAVVARKSTSMGADAVACSGAGAEQRAHGSGTVAHSDELWRGGARVRALADGGGGLKRERR